MSAPDVINSRDWGVVATVEKWHNAADRALGLPPDDTITTEDNLLVNGGIQNLLDLLCDIGSVTDYGSGSYIGVGTSTTAALATHAGLQAGDANKKYKAMESTFPSRVNQTMTWKSVWGSAEGNFAWEEWSIRSASSGSGGEDTGTALNRKVASLGTKASGSEWTLTVTITVS
tara:strand:- start:82 stop:600 length:519 start_codon:yes stop_codon:yes gene_type:complete